MPTQISKEELFKDQPTKISIGGVVKMPESMQTEFGKIRVRPDNFNPVAQMADSKKGDAVDTRKPECAGEQLVTAGGPGSGPQKGGGSSGISQKDVEDSEAAYLRTEKHLQNVKSYHKRNNTPESAKALEKATQMHEDSYHNLRGAQLQRDNDE